ncbi:hypothetical protein J5837_03080 [Pseudoxanthomonas helianthi]|uniref:Uncharacterized protein n=1 Tax=Pseudoxanthomonas helianthi TaxID=1453541 RepID=A0A940X1L6_9GAMM|nr:hypothetical protein [Pseudoxanthomonas helianthi]MBP3983396.1 hypothetical protein [Pseudoxanthomonas helianthi]
MPHARPRTLEAGSDRRSGARRLRPLAWGLSALAIAWVVRTLVEQRRADNAAGLARMVRMAGHLAAARALAEVVEQRASDEELRAAAERWQSALAPGGAWDELAEILPAHADLPYASMRSVEGLPSPNFDRRAAGEMRQWLETAHGLCNGLALSNSAQIRRRAHRAIALLEASACDIDLYGQRERLAAAPSPA